jgi:hypothetical protein
MLLVHGDCGVHLRTWIEPAAEDCRPTRVDGRQDRARDKAERAGKRASMLTNRRAGIGSQPTFIGHPLAAADRRQRAKWWQRCRAWGDAGRDEKCDIEGLRFVIALSVGRVQNDRQAEATAFAHAVLGPSPQQQQQHQRLQRPQRGSSGVSEALQRKRRIA